MRVRWARLLPCFTSLYALPSWQRCVNRSRAYRDLVARAAKAGRCMISAADPGLCYMPGQPTAVCARHQREDLMAEDRKPHPWLSTAIAVLALVTSVSSTLISWKAVGISRNTYEFKLDALRIKESFDDTCPLHPRELNGKDVVDLCWQFEAFNLSESPASIYAFNHWFDWSLSKPAGHDPNIIDHGGRNAYLIIAAIAVDQEVAKLAFSLIDSTHGAVTPTLADLMAALRASDLHILERPPAPKPPCLYNFENDGPNIREATVEVELSIETAAGKSFASTLLFSDQWDPARRCKRSPRG
jgi:hypothetical protein